MGRRPQGERAMTGAERMARYRKRHPPPDVAALVRSIAKLKAANAKLKRALRQRELPSCLD